MSDNDIDYSNIASKVLNRLGDAAGETGYMMGTGSVHPGDMGEHMEERWKELKDNGCTDMGGAMADVLFNDVGFWSMAQDWIFDEVRTAMQKRDGVWPDWGDATFKSEYNSACDTLASMAPYMKSEISKWKHKEVGA